MNHRVAIAIEECSGNVDIVARHLGRCTKFVVCEINPDKEIVIKETYFNPLSGHHGGQCQLPGYIKQFDVNTIIAGGIESEAAADFHQYGIAVITAPGLKYEEALKLFLANKLTNYEKYAGHDNHHN
ncbi:MAG: NifB/NifX family molybdenum-iron cluster-binding protein [Melioribacteraceae bacterium]|nr:NifB/NifX family molybdenum-iron cluster-binding protein [Melioribacteraceae bacterium]